MVRLRDTNTLELTNILDLFQFQYGAIKREGDYQHDIGLDLFQFQYGAIKSLLYYLFMYLF